MSAERSNTSGFTLLQLVIVIVVLLGGVAIVIVALGRSDRRAAYCQENLHAVGKAMTIYSALDVAAQSVLLLKPAPHTEAGVNAPPTAANTTDDDPILRADTLGDNAMQPVWLLVKENLITVDSFHCPADEGWKPRSGNRKYGWGSPNEFSYGCQYPYYTDAAGNANTGGPHQMYRLPSAVIFADRNPRTDASPSPPRSNHPNGVGILRRDSSVSFHEFSGGKVDYHCGVSSDDIYMNSDGVPGGMPVVTPGLLVPNVGGKVPSDRRLSNDTSICPGPSR